MQNQINLSPVTQFVQTLRSAELAQHREIKLTIQQARLLHLALTEILDKVNQDYETLYNDLKRSIGSEVITVEMDGGGFQEPK
jgi:hypothetical protein